jgi:nucleoside diphosphate kinase
MDGPIEGPPDAWARLAALNPLATPRASSTSTSKRAAAAAAAGTSACAFVLLRPAAVQSALISEICQRLERRGLSLVAMRMLKPGAEIAKKHYKGAAPTNVELAELVGALAPGPALATLWRGASALETARAIIGNEDVLAALPGTIRGDLSAVETADPLVELARDAEEVSRLTDVWFEAADLESAAKSLAAAPAPTPAPMLPSKHAAKQAAKQQAAKQPAGGGGAAAAAGAGKATFAPVKELGRFYISTAINYANGPPHMGHAYEAVAADCIARYHRAYGREVFFLTGSDEHGQKIADTAAGQGLKPIELADKHVAQFQDLDHSLGVKFDGYVRTTSDNHKKIARALWSKCEKNGGVYLGNYVGWYNVREETFVTETDAQANDFKDPVSGKPLKKMEEPSYFFRLSEYQQKLIDHIKSNPKFIMPGERRNEVLQRLAVPLIDLSVSRTTFDWGIAVPGDTPGHVMYVWFDALSNYISGIGYDPSAKDPAKATPTAKFWPADIHLIGKDIIWFHCVIWPALLMCSGEPLPKTILAHGFVHGADGKKMSKSIGNGAHILNAVARSPSHPPLPLFLSHPPLSSTHHPLHHPTQWSTHTTCSNASLWTRSASSSCVRLHSAAMSRFPRQPSRSATTPSSPTRLVTSCTAHSRSAPSTMAEKSRTPGLIRSLTWRR